MDLHGGLADQPAEAGGEVALQSVRERVVQPLPPSTRQALGQHPVVLEGLTERSPHVLRLRRTCLAGATDVRLMLADGVNESCWVMQDPEGNEFCLD